MAAVTRLGDKCGGHGCFPPRANDEGSPDVYVNGIKVHRVGDHWMTHSCPPSSHDGTLADGSTSVFVNGHGIARIGDHVSCGSFVAQGSGNVFAGG